MRRIALINQKGGVGKTTSTVNLGAALARLGRRVVLVDLDPQANLSMHLDCAVSEDAPSTYTVLTGDGSFVDALRPTHTSGLSIVPASIDLSGAELELANAFGRELLMREALLRWERDHRAAPASHGAPPADYVLLDCPPSLGLLSVNGLVAAGEALISVQTEFFALQGMSKLVEVVQLLQRRLNPDLKIAGILACLYDSRLKLAREVLAEIRTFFPGLVFRRAVAKNIKLAEAPSYGKTIFEYAPECSGASDYLAVAEELIAQEGRDAGAPTLSLPPQASARSATVVATPAQPVPPSPPSPKATRKAPRGGAPKAAAARTKNTPPARAKSARPAPFAGEVGLD